jgi:hypothetical protein
MVARDDRDVRFPAVAEAQRSERGFGLPGALLVLAGGLLVLAAFRFLASYDTAQGADPVGAITFGTPRSDPLRVVGFVVGLLGAGSTCYALAQHFRATGSDRSVFANSSRGLRATMLGYLLGAAGAVLGPRRSVSARPKGVRP